MTQIILCISGSRLPDFDEFKFETYFDDKIQEFIEKYGLPTHIIVGDCLTGVDKVAKKWLKYHTIPFTIYKADWNTYKVAAGPIRNKKMIDKATHLIAFPSKNGKGTQVTIKFAKQKGIPCFIYQDWE